MLASPGARLRLAGIIAGVLFIAGYAIVAVIPGGGETNAADFAKYYGPDGKSIQDNGVTPSVVQAAEGEASLDEDSESEGPEHFGEKDDLQLQKALEILKQNTSVAKAA